MNKLEVYKAKIDETLSTLIPVSSPDFPSLYEGARYALLAPGKRIRPLLTLCSAEMCMPGASQQALVPACVLEMVHTYSLIHDDLPCMDDDDFRRGLPTLHKVYTEGHAVLVGDYLLTHAFAILANAPHLSAEQKIAMVGTLASSAGGEGMIGGQVMDIDQSPNIEKTHGLKTAALFRASLAFGGIAAHASPAALSQLDHFAIQFGKLFQIIDDIHDGDHPGGSEKAEILAQALYRSTLEALKKCPGDHTLTQALIDKIFILTIVS